MKSRNFAAIAEVLARLLRHLDPPLLLEQYFEHAATPRHGGKTQLPVRIPPRHEQLMGVIATSVSFPPFFFLNLGACPTANAEGPASL